MRNLTKAFSEKQSRFFEKACKAFLRIAEEEDLDMESVNGKAMQTLFISMVAEVTDKVRLVPIRRVKVVVKGIVAPKVEEILALGVGK